MPAEHSACRSDERTLRVYLLGRVDFETFVRFQRLLHFEISGDRKQAALILCEHPPMITVGRQGSRSHIHLEAEELHLRGWPIHWVNRGGGCLLHLPGQLALYPILALDRLRCSIADYLQKLNETILAALDDFSISAPRQGHDEGVRVGGRLLAALGISVRDWVTGYGAYVNVHPPLELFRYVTACAHEQHPMTSLERERRGPVRPSLVRERLIEHFQSRFGFSRIALFSDHPALADATQRCRAPAANPETLKGRT